MKNLKIIITILLAIFSLQEVKSQWFTEHKAWFRCRVEAKCKDTDGNIRNDIGFVAVKFSTQPTIADKRTCRDSTHTGTTYYFGSGATSFRITAYMLAKGDGNWQFDHWELEDGTTLSNSNQEQGTASHTYNSTNRCPGNSTSGTHEHANWITEHTYYAVFREVVTQAVFAEAQPETLGEVKYLKENSIGDEITLRTYTLDYHNKFLGWVKQGDENNILTTDRVLTFTITDETKGTYIAKYDNGYNFVRFKNFGTGRYMDFTSDEGSLQNLESLELKDSYSNVVSEAGSVIEIAVGQVKGSSGSKHTYYDYYMQNAKASKFYDFDPTDPDPVTGGVYIRMPHDVDINVDTWALSTDDNVQSGYRIGDQNGAPHAYMGKRNEADWYIEPMDKDLETAENYFSLDPAKLVEVDGKYYTTLRTSWNILFNPDQMTPYVVTEVDEENGTFDMEPITGNIIPAGTPVIIETKSNVVLENRMVPTTTAAASDAVPSGNLLKVSTKYFPNQNAPVDNCKSLIKNANGQLAFGGNALNTVNGNEAYLSVANEVILPVKIPLAELLASGDTQRTYNITDLRAVELVDNDHMLICKDNNGYATKDEKGNEEYIDFMHTATLTNGISSTIPTTYDQSNWIGLRLSDGATLSYLLKTHQLKDVVGKLTNTVNPEFLLEQAPKANGELEPYTRNVYIAASFSGSNNQESLVNHNVYYFVQPKPMEFANVEWAQWDGEKFIVPVANEANPTWNQAQLTGVFEFNGSYLEQGGVFLEAGHSYEMLPAIIKYNDGSNYSHVYVLGDVNGQGWSPQKGVEMSTSDGNIYTATVTVNNVDNGFGYFSFTKKLAGRDEWDDIKDYRFGAVAEGENYYVDPNYLGNELPLAYWSSDSRSFQLAQGSYRLMVNLSTLKLVITPAQTGAPGLKGTTNGYVVYPLQINKVTTEENGVITAIDNLQAGKTVTRVVYYNMMGVESDVPHPGINIVEKRYSDGSRSVEKVIR